MRLDRQVDRQPKQTVDSFSGATCGDLSVSPLSRFEESVRESVCVGSIRMDIAQSVRSQVNREKKRLSVESLQPSQTRRASSIGFTVCAV